MDKISEKRLLDMILDEVKSVVSIVNEEDLIKLSKNFCKDKRVFVDGEGRSGLMGKAFAMRLMHIGYNSFVLGETITPSVKRDDLYIAISG